MSRNSRKSPSKAAESFGRRRRRSIIIICSTMGGGDYVRAIRIARTLESKRFDVRVMAWNRTLARVERDSLPGVALRVFNFPIRNSGRVALTVAYAFWWAFVVVSLLSEKSNVFHAQGFFCYPPVILVGKLRRKRIVYDLIDFVADSFLWSKGCRRLWSGWEGFCAALADGVMIVDLRKQDLGTSRLKAVAVVPNCPEDFGHGQARDTNSQPFTIYYGGALYEQRGIADVGEAIQDLPQTRMIVAGSGPDEMILRAKLSEPGNVQFLGLLNEDESIRLTMKSDLVFALYDPHVPINRRAVSAKLFDAMMCSKPVLVNQESVILASLVATERCGLVVPYGNIGAIKKAIQELIENPGNAMQMGVNGRKAFEREFNWSNMTHRLLRLYDEVLHLSPSP